MKATQRQTSILIILLGISIVYFAGGVFSLFDLLVHWSDKPGMPFDFGFRGRVISTMTPEAKQAGVQLGDSVMEIDGHPFTGRSVMRDELLAKDPGDWVEVKVRHADGKIALLDVELAARRKVKPSLAIWTTSIVVQLLLPLFCVLLGFWVVLTRPHDRRAWLLLFMMLGFESLTPISAWPGFWFTGWVAWTVLLYDTLPIFIMLFGISFPRPLEFDTKHPLVKWLILVPLALLIADDLWWTVGKQINFDYSDILGAYTEVLALLRLIFSVAAIMVFFVSLSIKSLSTKNNDERRRLRVLRWGAAVGLTPACMAILYSVVSGHVMGEGIPRTLLTACVLMVIVFPLTLAHVIVVQREMDVRMVLRVSMQYALAQGGLRVIRGVVSIIALIAFVDAFDNSPGETTFQHVAAAGAGAALLFMRQTMTQRVTLWMDRKFFREAYSTEQVLSELSEQARKFVESAPLLETVTQRIGETLHVERISVFLLAEGSYRCGALDLPGDCTTIELLRKSERPLSVYFDDPDSWVQYASEAERELLHTLNAQVLLPLSGRESLMGVMVLGPKRSEEPYSGTDLRLLQSVANQTGLTMENSKLWATLAAEAVKRERIARELEIAREVQERFFPQKFPKVPGLECAGKCRPALGVGGDYFDFLNLPDGGLGIAIGDVSGKGISAALLMASLRSSLRGQTIAGTSDLAGLMVNMNTLVYEASTSNRYATFFYGQIDLATRRLVYVNAGHNSPVVLRGSEVIALQDGGPVVGLLPHTGYVQSFIDLLPGDIFLGYTDGISEAMNHQDEEWGEAQMVLCAQRLAGLSAMEIINGMIAGADVFADGAEQHDDMTLLVIKVL